MQNAGSAKPWKNAGSAVGTAQRVREDGEEKWHKREGCREKRLMRRDREIVDFTRSRVKNNTELTNFRKFTRIEGYNGKYGSNPQGIKQFLDVFFKFDQIGREIDGRNWGKWYFMKVDFKTNSRNQKSSKMILISWRNRKLKWREIFER